MNIDFTVKHYSGLAGSLNMQIIPSSLEENKNFLNSIVIDEVAFSLVEKFFLENEDKYSHWGHTFIGFDKVKLIIDSLYAFHAFLREAESIYDENINLIFKEETDFLIFNFSKIKPSILKMIEDIIYFLEGVARNKINGITIIGV